MREGDEVIVPAYTYTASASAAIHCGATVKFVDIQKDGDPVTHMPEMNYEALEEVITEKTKAVVTVDLGGIVCDYDRVFEIVERKKSLFHAMNDHSNPLSDLSSRIQAGLGRVAVVCDAAHALGASRTVSHTGRGKQSPQKRWVGSIADFTDFSFHAVKNFTTAEGGASTWCLPEAVYKNGVTDAEIYKMYQLLSLHGQNKDALAKSKVGAWEYDIIGPWYKCNMTDIMAAIGLRQLDRYLGLLARREQMMKRYNAVCDELGISYMKHHVEGMDSCVSNTSYQDYPSLIKRIKGNRIQALQNGVDIERIDGILSSTEPVSHDYVNFIYVARLIPLKNHKFLVDVLSHCEQKAHFTFVGAEDVEKAIRKKTEEGFLIAVGPHRHVGSDRREHAAQQIGEELHHRKALRLVCPTGTQELTHLKAAQKCPNRIICLLRFDHLL